MSTVIIFINSAFLLAYMKYEAKSVVFGRKPRQNPEEFKTAFFKVYKELNPFTQEFPAQELDFPNTEKVLIENPNCAYYLEGNDLVFDNISALIIEELDNNVLKVTVE